MKDERPSADVRRIVHAFSDKGRKDDVREIARRVEETERALDRMRDALEDLAEHDCAYGDGCPENAGTRHGTCMSCVARKALVPS